MKQEQKEYLAPTLLNFEVLVERGFGESLDGITIPDYEETECTYW